MKFRKQLKYNVAEVAIKKLIAERNCQVNDAIPSVRELAQVLPFSMITLRRALSGLEESGLIARKIGSGTYLKHPVSAVPLGSYILYLDIKTLPGEKTDYHRYHAGHLNSYLTSRGVGLRYLAVTEFDSDVTEMAENASGIIVSGTPGRDFTEKLKMLRLPFILIGCWEEYEDAPQLSFDAAESCCLMTEHFIKRGRRKILFYDHSPDYLPDNHFRRGYLEAVEKAGLEPMILRKRSIDTHLFMQLSEHFARHPDTDALLITPSELFQYHSWMIQNRDTALRSIGFLGSCSSDVVDMNNPDFVFMQNLDFDKLAAERLLDNIISGKELHSESFPGFLQG